MMPSFESLLDDVALMPGEALGLGPDGAATLDHLLTIVATILLSREEEFRRSASVSSKRR